MKRSPAGNNLRRALPYVSVALMLSCLSGCSLFVMAGKMIWGDPKTAAAFSNQTGIDLTDGEHTLLVVCRTPHLIKNELPTFEYDLTDGLLRRLRQAGVKTISPDDVSEWLDDNAGEFESATELAEDFDADYIAVVDMSEVSFNESNSPGMFRGSAQGSIRAYEVQTVGERRQAYQVFSGGFDTQYPRFNPVSVHSVSKRVFQKQFVDHLNQHIARQFHDYRMGDGF